MVEDLYGSALSLQRQARMEQQRMAQQQLGVIGAGLGSIMPGKIMPAVHIEYPNTIKLSFRERLQKETDEWLKGVMDI